MTQAVTQGSTSTYSYDYAGGRMPKAPKAVELVHRQVEKAVPAKLGRDGRQLGNYLNVRDLVSGRDTREPNPEARYLRLSCRVFSGGRGFHERGQADLQLDREALGP